MTDALGFVGLSHPVQPSALAQDEKQDTAGNVLSATLKLPAVWLATLFLFVYVGIEVSLVNWAYSFLLGSWHEGTVLAGWIVSGYWLGLTLGRFLLQNLAERVGLGTKGLVYICMIAVGVGLLLIALWRGLGYSERR